MLDLEYGHDLSGDTTFGVPARCDQWVSVRDDRQLEEALAHADRHRLPRMMLGEGSNVLFTGDRAGLLIHMAIPGIRFEEKSDHVLVHAGAGVNWHHLVSTCLERGWHGLENLALIPGSAGAAPVQNIGAYGVELADRLVHVQWYDAGARRHRWLMRDECQFAYRDSVFRGELTGQGAITGITLRLWRDAKAVAEYPSLLSWLEEHERDATPRNVYDAVCDIRRSKLPDPARIGNAGSFFRNPVLTKDQFRALQQRVPKAYGAVPSFPAGAGDAVKVPAAWLIERAGWKGQRCGDAGIHDRQALVLVNHGGADGSQIARLAARVADDVLRKFQVHLEPEVTIL